MKSVMLPAFYQLFDHIKPSTICEIGTHDAKSAVQFIDYCIKINPKLKYYGFDIFDAVKNDKRFHEVEINGKGAGKYSTAKNNLDHKRRKYKKFKFELYKGYTQDTLTDSKYDFVYIDGGHSYETVKHDYNKVKNSKIIVFDDYQTDGVKSFVDELVIQQKLVEVNWPECLDYGEKCYSFLPKTSKHIQVVIFNA